MTLNRRDFFRLAAVGSTTLIAGKAMAEEKGINTNYSDAMSVLVDTTFCIGCRKCEFGCNQANNLPSQPLKAFDDKSVFKQHRRPSESAYTVVNSIDAPEVSPSPIYLKVQCMHCNDPACASACIVGALKKNEKGPVVYDAWKCIGCRYCMVACPFQIPGYEYANALTPQVRKCTFCLERVTKEGKKPGCVEICPNEALTFGNRKDILELAHNRIMQSPGRYVNHVYGEKEIGGTSWMYISGVDFEKTELPRLENENIPDKTEIIQHGIFKSFVPPVALYGLLGLVMYSLRKRNSAGGGGSHE